MHEPTANGSSPGARNPLRIDPAVYGGEAGRTRVESVHVPGADGSIRSVQVVRCVNADTDPELAARARGGTLHRLESGEELVLSFVYHDPSARRLLLVVPEGLRHQELLERSQLLARMSLDTSLPVPPYARNFEVVFGTTKLIERLNAAADPTSGTGAEGLAELEEREARLRERAEIVTRREDELRAQEASVEHEKRLVLERKRALDERERMLAEWEARLGARAFGSPTAEEAEELDDAALLEDEELESVLLEGDTDVTRIFTPVPLESRPPPASAQPAPPPHRSSNFPPAMRGEAAPAVPRISERPPALRASDRPPARPSERPPGVAPKTDSMMPPRRESARPPSLSPASLAPVPPPADFLADRDQEMRLARIDGQTWGFVRLDEGHEESFRGGAELLVQLVVIEQRPVVVLALGDTEGARPYVRRTALDPLHPDARALLDALRKDYSVRVALFTSGDHFDRVVRVGGSRTGNVAAILERLSGFSVSPSIDAGTALERVLAVPPPTRDVNQPFRVDDAQRATSAAEARSLVLRLTEWSRPERIEHAILVLSVPPEAVEATFRRVLEDAVRFGVALPSELLERVVSLGVAPNLRQLLSRQLMAFRKIVARSDRGGLAPEEIAENWDRLFALATEQGLSIDASTRSAAGR